MLWSRKRKFRTEPFVKEADLETAIQEVKLDLFGSSRIYLDIKKIIGRKGKKKNVPDGYLIDLSSTVQPSLYFSGKGPLRSVRNLVFLYSGFKHRF